MIVVERRSEGYYWIYQRNVHYDQRNFKRFDGIS